MWLRESADLAQELVTKILAVCALVGDQTLLKELLRELRGKVDRDSGEVTGALVPIGLSMKFGKNLDGLLNRERGKERSRRSEVWGPNPTLQVPSKGLLSLSKAGSCPTLNSRCWRRNLFCSKDLLFSDPGSSIVTAKIRPRLPDPFSPPHALKQKIK
jgi:hypothetical protein